MMNDNELKGWIEEKDLGKLSEKEVLIGLICYLQGGKDGITDYNNSLMSQMCIEAEKKRGGKK